MEVRLSSERYEVTYVKLKCVRLVFRIELLL
jgi:hypothetical protein